MELEAQAVKTVNENMFLLEREVWKYFRDSLLNNHFSNISNLMLFHSELKLWNWMMESRSYFLCAKPDQNSGSVKGFLQLEFYLFSLRGESHFDQLDCSCEPSHSDIPAKSPHSAWQWEFLRLSGREMTTDFISNLIDLELK